MHWLKKKADVHLEAMKMFDRDERYVVAYYMSSHAKSTWLSWLIARCAVAMFFLFDLCQSDQAVLFAAFGSLFLLDIYGQWRQPRFTRILCSVIHKMEARIEELEVRLSDGFVVPATSPPPADSPRQ
jgi:hypothetical protein